MSPTIPLPSKWIGWVVAGLAVLCFGLALTCPKPTPSERIVKDVATLAKAQVKHEAAKERADTLRTEVKAAHARTKHALTVLKPLRESVSITPNGIASVNGDTSAAVVMPALIAVVQHQDSALAASQDENRVKDLRHVSDSTVNVTGEAVVVSATTLGTDALKESHPRCSTTCGIAIGGGIVTVVVFVIHALVK